MCQGQHSQLLEMKYRGVKTVQTRGGGAESCFSQQGQAGSEAKEVQCLSQQRDGWAKARRRQRSGGEGALRQGGLSLFHYPQLALP